VMGSGTCTAAFVLPVPADWAADTYWAQARNTDGTKSNYAAIVVTSSHQMPAGQDTADASWLDSVGILNGRIDSGVTIGKTYTIDIHGWNILPGAKIVYARMLRYKLFPESETLPITETAYIGLGHVRGTITMPNDANIGLILVKVQNPGGTLSRFGGGQFVYLSTEGCTSGCGIIPPDDQQISVSPISGPFGTTFTFKYDCKFPPPTMLQIFGLGGNNPVVTPQAGPTVGSVCSVKFTMSGTIRGEYPPVIGTGEPVGRTKIEDITVPSSSGFYEIKPVTFAVNQWLLQDLRAWTIEVK